MKLFASYVVVVAIGTETLVLAAGLATPSIFDLHMAQMVGNGVQAGGLAWAWLARSWPGAVTRRGEPAR